MTCSILQLDPVMKVLEKVVINPAMDGNDYTKEETYYVDVLGRDEYSPSRKWMQQKRDRIYIVHKIR